MTDKLIEQIEDRADWLVDAVATATQNRMFLRGEPECDDVACVAIQMNGEKAMQQVTAPLQARILADAEVIKAAGPLVKRLKALQTYFDLSDEELASMTRDERADTIRQHKLITEVLDAFYRARTDTDAEAALEAVKREARNEALREEEARAHRLRLRL